MNWLQDAYGRKFGDRKTKRKGDVRRSPLPKDAPGRGMVRYAIGEWQAEGRHVHFVCQLFVGLARKEDELVM